MNELGANIEHLVITNDKVPVAAYQAIYHKLTSKVEKLTQTFDDAYRISAEDVVQLDYLLCQVIKQYPVKSSNSTCSVALRKDETIEFSSIEKFRRTGVVSNKPTALIIYEFDFFTVLPVEIENAQDIVQRFKVSVAMDQDFVEDPDNGVPYYISNMATGRNIRLLVEYSDFAVGRNLQTTVNDWVQSLNTRRKGVVVRFFERRADFLNAYTGQLFAAASLIGLSRWSLDNSSDMPYSFILLALGIATAMYVVGRALNVFFYRRLTQAKPLTLICLTNGDRARAEKMAQSASSMAWAAGFLGVTIVAGLAVNICSSFLMKWAGWN